MKSHEIIFSENTLLIRRRKSPFIWRLLVFGLLFCLMLIVPLSNIFVYHFNIYRSIWLASFWALLFFPMLIGMGTNLAKKVVILDKLQDQVLVNGRRICALSDVRSVNVGSYIVPTAKNRPFKIRGLYLKTTESRAVEIERAVHMGSSYKEVGSAIADFLKIYSSIS